MKVMSLFAGIGGFDLAAEKMGWTTAVQVELDEWCRKILAKNFPNAIRYGDIKTFDGKIYTNGIDLLCGGFPCQPYSNAGKRLGSKDDRHLWPEMFRVIREVRPRWIVGENVSGMLSWNAGLVFNQVLSDLESEGYEVQTFVLPACGINAPHKRERVWIVAYRDDRLSQSTLKQLRTRRETSKSGSNGTPADTDSIRSGTRNKSTGRQTGTNTTRSCKRSGLEALPDAGSLNGSVSVQQWRQESTSDADIGGQSASGIITDTQGIGRNGTSTPEPGKYKGCKQVGGCNCTRDDANSDSSGWEKLNTPDLSERSGFSTRLCNANVADSIGIGCRNGIHGRGSGPRKTDERRNGDSSKYFADWPTQPPLCTGNDGVSSGLVRPANWRSLARWRTQAIKAAGNAVVWQVVYQIFQAIQETENTLSPC